MPPHECMIEHNLGQKLYGTHLLPQMQITDVILFIRMNDLQNLQNLQKLKMVRFCMQ